MLFIPVIVSLGIIVPVTYFAVHKLMPMLVKRKAISKLEMLLFPEGYWQKQQVLKICRELTGSRFNDEDIMDYFLKIKGLHAININSKTNFWLKKYLFSPTCIKLNYFEQVKFYETFLNYPAPQKKGKQMFNNSPNRQPAKQRIHLPSINKVPI